MEEIEWERSETVREEFQLLLRAKALLRVPEKDGVTRAYYEKVGASFFSDLIFPLGEKLRRDYALLSDTRAKSRFGPTRILLSSSVTWEDDTHLFVLAALKTEGKNPASRKTVWVWQKEEETLLPLRQVKRMFRKVLKKRKPDFPPDGIYRTEDELVLFQNAREGTEAREVRIAL